MKLSAKISFGISLVLAFWACNGRDTDFPKTPELFPRSFVVSDSNLVWSIGFTDGDGDIGVRNDADPNNFFVTTYKIENGVPIELPDVDPYRIPILPDVNTRNGIEGEFKFTISIAKFLINNIDSAFMQGYVVDRSNNQSNIVTTPEFAIN